MGNYLLTWLGSGLLLFSPHIAAGQEADPLDFLIFRNGATLAGRIVQDGQWYVLRSASGQGESRYPINTVLKVCHGPQETYLFLKERIRPDEAQDHCHLARLCAKEGLDKEAREEIQTALKLDRSCSEARSLLTQLDNKDKKPEAAVPQLPTAVMNPLPAARLEDWPQAATGFFEFTKRIQPILLNGCGTGACHGTAEGKRAFILTRGLYGAPPSPLTSRANLERVLGLVDKEHAEESPLLKRALQMHGGAKTAPLLASDQAAYLQLQAWVANVCGVRPETIAKTNQASTKSTGTTDFASDAPPSPSRGEGKGGGGSPAAFAASERGVSQAFQPDRQPGKADLPNESTTSLPPANTDKPQGGATGRGSLLPIIPGLTGKAASQLGQPSPPQQQGTKPPTPGPGPEAKSQPPRNFKDDPEFLNYSRLLGVRPMIPPPDREPPKQIRVQNAGTFEITTPPIPDIPEELKRPVPPKESPTKDENGKEIRFLNNGAIVNPPK